MAYECLELLPEQFWQLTPREFDLMMKGHDHREDLKLERTAWALCQLLNATGNFKRLVSIDDLIVRKKGEHSKADPNGWEKLMDAFDIVESEVTSDGHSG
jgi:hypothetical protein